MKETEIEPGVILVFRIIVLVKLIPWIIFPVLGTISFSHFMILSYSQYLSLIAIQSFCLFVLLNKKILARFKKIIIPFTLILTIIPFLIEKWWLLEIGVANDASLGKVLQAFSVQQGYVLLLLIIAWQYKLKYSIIYTFSIAVIEMFMIIERLPSDSVITYLTFIALAGRSFIYLIIGFVIRKLVERQKNQQYVILQSNKKLHEANKQLARYAATVESLSTTRERNRLAHELHDTLSHSLSAASVQLEAIDSLWDSKPGKAREILKSVDTTVREGLDESRRALQGLRASPLEELGLAIAVKSALERAAKRGNLILKMDIRDLAFDLPDHVEQVVYRIVIEASENVIRHSEAKNIYVKLEEDGDCISLTVQDDGIGFDVEKSSDETDRFGIKSMQERAKLVGGKVCIHSEINEGTILTFECPFLGDDND